MGSKHIREILDSKPFFELNEEEIEKIQSHIEVCEDCLLAFKASKLSGLLLSYKKDQIVQPPPFFHTKILAKIRDKSREKFELSLARIWEAVTPVLMMMTAIVLSLAIITLVLPSASDNASSVDVVSTEMIIMNEKLNHELTNDQVLQMLYKNEQKSGK
mgnify:CR=1 FL=1